MFIEKSSYFASLYILFFMKKECLLLIFMCVTTLSFGISIEQVRDKHKLAIQDKATALELIELLENDKNKTPLKKAYMGSVYAILCKHLSNPVKRLQLAKKAAFNLNEAVSMSPKDIEVRFIRFAFESQVPKVLGHSKHLQEDKQFLINHFKQLNTSGFSEQTIQDMYSFLKESNKFTPTELLAMQE